MKFEISILQLIIVCAIVNGFVFSFLLLTKAENRSANRFLSLLIVSMSLTYTPYALDTSIWNSLRWLVWMPFSLSYWIGPALYFYVRALIKPREAFRNKDLWHFTPIIMNYIHSIYHAIAGNTNPCPGFHYVAEFFESGAILSVLIYMMICYKMITSYQRNLLNKVSSLEHIDLKWIKRIIAVIIGSFVLILSFLILSGSIVGKETIHRFSIFRQLVLLLYAGILYWVSISGFNQAQITGHHELSAGDEPSDLNEFPKVITHIKKIIEDAELYRNPELSVSDLSKATGLSVKTISNALNGLLNKNFYRFINEYRVEEMKAGLLDPKMDHLTILSIALDSGFNSKASAYRIFKAYTGSTPKDFKNAVRQNME